MLRKPKFDFTDKIEYKAGKRGYHQGFVNGNIYTVKKLKKPQDKKMFKSGRLGEWGGWVVYLEGSNSFYPASWFKKVEEKR